MIRRGSLWWAELGVPRGSEPGFRRPIVVVSADAYNRSRIATILCVIVTANVGLGRAPGNVLLPAGTGGLRDDSVANVSQIVTLDKTMLGDRIGRLDAPKMELLDAGLRRVLGL